MKKAICVVQIAFLLYTNIHWQVTGRAVHRR